MERKNGTNRYGTNYGTDSSADIVYRRDRREREDGAVSRRKDSGQGKPDVISPVQQGRQYRSVNRTQGQKGTGTASSGYERRYSGAYRNVPTGRTSRTSPADAAEAERVRRGQNRITAPASRSYSSGNADSEEAEAKKREQRRRQREQQRRQRARAVRRMKIMMAFGAVLAIFIVFAGSRIIHKAWAQSKLSDSVLGYRSTVEHYAEQEGVEDYVDTLLAIMMVESEGQGKDVMQSSESKGLARNSLKPEESIEQACIYYAALIEISRDLGIDDDKALIQAYNFGPGYLSYLSEHGGKHRQKYAIAYAKELSGGEKIRYLHLYAIRKNGGWIYKFGNMFYDALVEQYL